MYFRYHGYISTDITAIVSLSLGFLLFLVCIMQLLLLKLSRQANTSLFALSNEQKQQQQKFWNLIQILWFFDMCKRCVRVTMLSGIKEERERKMDNNAIAGYFFFFSLAHLPRMLYALYYTFNLNFLILYGNAFSCW